MKTKAQFILSKSKVLEKYEEMKSISDEVSYSLQELADMAQKLKILI